MMLNTGASSYNKLQNCSLLNVLKMLLFTGEPSTGTVLRLWGYIGEEDKRLPSWSLQFIGKRNIH